MSNTDSGYAEPSDDARAQPASRKPRSSHGRQNQKARDLPRAQYLPQLHTFRDHRGTSDPALDDSLPDFTQPSPLDDNYNQEPESLAPAPAADLTLAGLLGADPGSFGMDPLNLNPSAYGTMTPTTSVYPDPQLPTSDFYSFLTNNQPWNVYDTASFNDCDMSPSNINYQQTSGPKRRKLRTDSGVETQMSSTSPRDSSPAATQRSVAKSKKADRHFCHICPGSKSGGFSTSNDLARHQRGVHGIFEPGDKIWRCRVPGCTCADKIWPRRDNFSSHLKRMHFNGDDNNVKEVIDSYQEYYDPDQHARMDVMKNEATRESARSNPPAPASSTVAPPLSSSFTSASMGQQFYLAGQSGQQYVVPDQYTDRIPRQLPRGPRTSGGSYGPRLPPATTRSALDITVNPTWLTIPPFTGDPQRDLTRPSGAFTAPPNADTRSRQKRELEEQDQATEQSSRNRPSVEDWISIGQGVGQQTQCDLGAPSDMSSEHHTIKLDTNFTHSKPALDELKDVFSKLSPEAKKEAKNLFRSSSPGTLAKLLNETKQDDEPHENQNVRKRSVSKSPTKKNADDEKTLRCDCVKQQKGDKKPSWVVCDASFSSRSELRKHMKRHDKRFACTFDRCYSKFGTKWEWKRHEQSQHIQNDAWRCRQNDNGETCQLLYCDEQEFRNHLVQHFGNADAEFIATEVRDCYLAKKWLGSFWCGYCPGIQRSSKAFGRKMDEERTDHIAGHILKGCKSSEWVELDGRGKTKRQMQEMEEHGGRQSRLHSRSTGSPAQSYRPEDTGEEGEEENSNDNEQVDATSSSDSDSARRGESVRSRPPLQVSMPGSYSMQTGPLSAPPVIQVHPPDVPTMPDHMLRNMNTSSMQQTRFHLMNDATDYGAQQPQPRLLQPIPTTRRLCCNCQQWGLYLNGQHGCGYCQHQFCQTCPCIMQPPGFSDSVYSTGMGQETEEFDGFA